MKDSANGAPPGEFPGDFRNDSLDFGWDTFDERPSSSSAVLSSTMAGPLCVVSLGSWSTSSLVALFRLLEISKYAVFCPWLGCIITPHPWVSCSGSPPYTTL